VGPRVGLDTVENIISVHILMLQAFMYIYIYIYKKKRGTETIMPICILVVSLTENQFKSYYVQDLLLLYSRA
jgi:hypothetical protein